MARHIGEHQDHSVYRTFDDRIVSRKLIERVLHDLEARDRRRAVVERMHSWITLAIVILVVMIITAALWWHLLPHL